MRFSGMRRVRGRSLVRMDSAARNPVTAVIVVAAGSGQRLGYGMPKAKVPLGGDSILTHALRGVAAAGVAHQICVAIPPGDSELKAQCEAFAAELQSEHRRTAAAETAVQLPVVTIVDGGASRAESVRAGMAALEPGMQSVLVHDAARALTPEAVFHRVAAALAAGAVAVIPVIPVVDTIKTVDPTFGDDAGIAPLQASEAGPAGGAQLTRFNREARQIDQGPLAASAPLRLGSQDRASVLMQLAGIGLAEPEQMQDTIDIVVAGTGSVRVVRWQVAGSEELETAAGVLATVRLVQLAPAGEARVEVWLAPQRAWLPVQLRVTGPDGTVANQMVTSIQTAPSP